jgi:hypothetical protein
MSNWVQERAHDEANIWQEPSQLWSALKTSVQKAVATWITIYSPPGIQDIVVSPSADLAGNSFTVRVLSAPFDLDRKNSLEVTFDESHNLILVTPQPYKKTFRIHVDEARNKVGLTQQDVPSSKDLLIEDACRLILEPLIESLGHRAPVTNEWVGRSEPVGQEDP